MNAVEQVIFEEFYEIEIEMFLKWRAPIFIPEPERASEPKKAIEDRKISQDEVEA